MSGQVSRSSRGEYQADEQAGVECDNETKARPFELKYMFHSLKAY